MKPSKLPANGLSIRGRLTFLRDVGLLFRLCSLVSITYSGLYLNAVPFEPVDCEYLTDFANTSQDSWHAGMSWNRSLDNSSLWNNNIVSRHGISEMIGRLAEVTGPGYSEDVSNNNDHGAEEMPTSLPTLKLGALGWASIIIICQRSQDNRV